MVICNRKDGYKRIIMGQFLLFLNKNVCCGYSLELPRRWVPTTYVFIENYRELFFNYQQISSSSVPPWWSRETVRLTVQYAPAITQEYKFSEYGDIQHKIWHNNNICLANGYTPDRKGRSSGSNSSVFESVQTCCRQWSTTWPPHRWLLRTEYHCQSRK